MAPSCGETHTLTGTRTKFINFRELRLLLAQLPLGVKFWDTPERESLPREC
jgi:hypothetical protein